MHASGAGQRPKGGSAPSRKVAKEFAAADHKRGAKKLPERVGDAIVQGRSAKDI